MAAIQPLGGNKLQVAKLKLITCLDIISYLARSWEFNLPCPGLGIHPGGEMELFHARVCVWMNCRKRHCFDFVIVFMTWLDLAWTLMHSCPVFLYFFLSFFLSICIIWGRAVFHFSSEFQEETLHFPPSLLDCFSERNINLLKKKY